MIFGMIPKHFPWMVWAELRKVYTRGSGIGALVIAALTPLATLGFMQWAAHTTMLQVGTGSLADSLYGPGHGLLNAVQCAGWALKARNFFVLPLFLLLSASSTVAGELAERTLREDLVRPIPRWSALAARIAGTGALAATTLVVTAALSFLPGLLLFGLPVDGSVPVDYPTVGHLALGYLASFASDVGLIAITVMLSLIVRSVGGVVVTLVLVLMADKVVYWGLEALNQAATIFKAPSLAFANDLVPWTLGNALGCWEGWQTAFEPMRFVALAVVTVAATAAAMARLSRMDVP